MPVKGTDLKIGDVIKVTHHWDPTDVMREYWKLQGKILNQEFIIARVHHISGNAQRISIVLENGFAFSCINNNDWVMEGRYKIIRVEKMCT